MCETESRPLGVDDETKEVPTEREKQKLLFETTACLFPRIDTEYRHARKGFRV